MFSPMAVAHEKCQVFVVNTRVTVFLGVSNAGATRLQPRGDRSLGPALDTTAMTREVVPTYQSRYCCNNSNRQRASFGRH